MEKVLVIVGPTAVGKTALSVELAKKFHGEIISGDSLQVYKKLDIGTAKIKTSEMEGIPHHLIDVIEPNETYSVADFQKAGRKLITEITERGRLPMIVGGTGLYIQSLLYDFQLGAKEESVTAVRKKYEELAETLSKKELWEYLKTQDPLAAEKIHWNNQRKVIRALEVFEVTGYSITTPQEEPARLYDYCMIGLNTERALLYQRINQRVDSMLEEGLLEDKKTSSENLMISFDKSFPKKEKASVDLYFVDANKSQIISIESPVNTINEDNKIFAENLKIKGTNATISLMKINPMTLTATIKNLDQAYVYELKGVDEKGNKISLDERIGDENSTTFIFNNYFSDLSLDEIKDGRIFNFTLSRSKINETSGKESDGNFEKFAEFSLSAK